MSSFETTLHIPSDPADVWATLLQTDRWPDWDTQLDRVDGELGPGERVTLQVADTSRPFKLKVATWEPERRIVLTGGMPFGLFTGTRTYRLDPHDGGTQFSMTERFTGPMAGIIGKSIPDLQPSFEAFASGLREASAS